MASRYKDSYLKTPFSRKIAKYRDLMGMTCEELGKAVGATRSCVMHWEHGAFPKIETIRQLVKFSGIPATYWISEEDRKDDLF